MKVRITLFLNAQGYGRFVRATHLDGTVMAHRCWASRVRMMSQVSLRACMAGSRDCCPSGRDGISRAWPRLGGGTAVEVKWGQG